MKNTVTLIITLTFFISANAQNFQQALSEAYNRFERTDTLQNKMNAINRLDLIAAKWSDQWAAHYYAAYAKVVVSYLLEDEKQRDAIIDQAEQSLLRTKALRQTMDDELYVMDAYVASARLSVKSGSRWKKYGAIFDTNLDEAKKLNPENPRIYFLKGQALFYTPKAFGGGIKKALPLFEKAQPIFQAESKASLERPSWGHAMNTYYLGECTKNK
jgi:hypothetical protein